MSLRVSRNLGPFTTGPQSIFALKQWLCTGHGGTKFWSVVASGDGLAAYSSSGDIISHNGTGANGLNNSNAWFVLRDPDNNREILFHRSASGHQYWNVWYLCGEAFDTSGADADTPATHANKKSMMEARAAGPANIFQSGGSWYYHICCEGDTAEGNVYPFWAIGRVAGSGLTAGAIILDCVIDVLSPAADSDKAVMLATIGALKYDDEAYLGYSSTGLTRWSGYMRFGEANVEWGGFAMPLYYDLNSNLYPGAVPTHPEDGKFPILPGFYWRRAGVTLGVKGQSKLVTYKPSTTTLAVFGDTMYDGVDYHLVVDHVLLRGWPDSTGPTI